ncbi:MAG: isochorismatase family protein [Rhodospirillales bacterium]
MSDDDRTDPLPQRRRSRAGEASLIVVDVQEKLFVAIPSGPKVEANIGLLLDAADALDMPVTVTEHMAESIGPTRGPVTERLPKGAALIAKTHFSGWDEPKVRAHLESLAAAGHGDFAICGLEAHVCVQQTALGLLEAGHRVRIVADAAGSRDYEDRSLALERMRDAGCDIVSTEAIAFEWLERGDTPAFKKLLRTIRDRRPSDGGDA